MILPSVLLSVLLAAGPAGATDAELVRRVHRGIDAIYRMEFDESERTFRDILRDFPGVPHGHLGVATVSWARFEYEHEEGDLALHDEFEKRVDEGIARGKEWLKVNPADAEAHLAVSGMYGMRSRLSMMLHRWIRAYLDGNKAIKLLHKAHEIDGQLYDVNLGLGMWDYYTDTLPGVIKALGRIVAIRGDARRGIDRLKLSAEKGNYTASVSKLVLIELYQDRKTPFFKPKEGLQLIRDVRKQFPMHPLFHFVEVIYLYENELAVPAVREAENFLRAIETGKKFYHARYAPRGYVALGTAYFLAKDWAKASEAFGRGAKDLDGKTPNRWGLYSLIRRGQMKDLLGDREGAVADYQRALEQQDLWELRDVAKRFLKTPAAESDVRLSPIPPP